MPARLAKSGTYDTDGGNDIAGSAGSGWNNREIGRLRPTGQSSRSMADQWCCGSACCAHVNHYRDNRGIFGIVRQRRFFDKNGGGGAFLPFLPAQPGNKWWGDGDQCGEGIARVTGKSEQ